MREFIAAAESEFGSASLDEGSRAGDELRSALGKFAQANGREATPALGAQLGHGINRIAYSSHDGFDGFKSSFAGLKAISRALEHPRLNAGNVDPYFDILCDLTAIPEYLAWAKSGMSLPIGTKALAIRTLISLQRHPEFDFSRHSGPVKSAFETIYGQAMKPVIRDGRLQGSQKGLNGSAAMEFFKAVRRRGFHPDRVLEVAERIREERASAEPRE